MIEQLQQLQPGQKILFGGDKVTSVSPELADNFVEGDKVIVVNDSGDVLHVPASQWDIASTTVDEASDAFAALAGCSDQQITDFYERFAALLADDDSFAAIAEANRQDVAAAKAKGRSVTRLILDEKMRSDMVAGLQMWASQPSSRDQLVDETVHEGWKVQQRKAGIGVVGFIFEGRPNVFADACGVLRSGNTVVFRIGSDAYQTAQAIVSSALLPALEAAGLPLGAACLLPSRERSVGWALFSNPGLSLAVARGSGKAVSQLGAVARQSGVPVSLHGTGGAWMVVGEGADYERLQAVVANSLDRKVCNTLNTVCVLRSQAERGVQAVLAGLNEAANRRGVNPKLHVVDGSQDVVPQSWFDEKVQISRAGGSVTEAKATVLPKAELATEWEWEDSPEITLIAVDSVQEAVELFGRYAPRFVASLISEDSQEQDRFWQSIDAPFVGDGFTRWVDGQYAFGRPELGLSNWAYGRLFARGGVLSGDSVFTVRSRVIQTDPDVRR